MKAITLTQPWATAVALGIKHFETRSWYTAYRGPLAIHAAKGWGGDDKNFAMEMAVPLGIRFPRDLPTSCIVAICELVDCRSTNSLITNALGQQHADVAEIKAEHEWGDFAYDRYYWRLANVQKLDKPIPARGALGLWEWADIRPPKGGA